MKRIGTRLLAGLCMLLSAVLFCTAIPVSAAEDTGTLTVWCIKDDEILQGMHWRIYRVGHRSENDYIFEGEYADYRPTLGDRSKSMLDWNAKTVASVAETLRINTLLDQLPFLAEGYIGADGSLDFAGLKDGLYLVIGDTMVRGNTTYKPGAIFFEVRCKEENMLNAFPKIVFDVMDNTDVRYSVRKVWANNEDQPLDENVFITCELYRDGELHDTVRLDRSNNWQYKWSDDSTHQWLVREKEIPENYTVSYENNHYQYIIVNTYEETTTETTTTTQGTTTQGTTTQGTTSYTTTVTTARTTQVTTNTEKLVQTGQLWWPVPFLCGGGMLMIGTGIRLRRKEENDEHKEDIAV